MQGRLPSKNVQYLYDALDLKKKCREVVKEVEGAEGVGLHGTNHQLPKDPVIDRF